MNEYKEASEAAKRLAAQADREAEAAILLEAGSKVIAMQEKEKEVMALLLDQKVAEIRELIAKVDTIQANAALVVHALDCSTQLITALLAWLPEGLPLSPDVGSAKGAWSDAMKKVIR